MYQKEIIVQDSLWQSFVNGSREAYARLYELYVRPMYLYGLHFCEDRQIIEDAIHDIFVRIYVNRERLPELKNVKLYLLISLKNTLLNQLVAEMEKNLSARQKQAVYYRFVEQMHYNEIGAMMEINSQSAKNLVHSSIKKIREIYPHLSGAFLLLLFNSL